MSLSMIFWLVGLFVGAAILRLVAAVLPGLKIDDWGNALLAVFVMSLASWGLGFVWAALPPIGLWASLPLLLFANLVSLALAAAVLPGIHVNGVPALFVAAVLLTVFDFAMPALIGSAPLVLEWLG